MSSIEIFQTATDNDFISPTIFFNTCIGNFPKIRLQNYIEVEDDAGLNLKPIVLDLINNVLGAKIESYYEEYDDRPHMKIHTIIEASRSKMIDKSVTISIYHYNNETISVFVNSNDLNEASHYIDIVNEYLSKYKVKKKENISYIEFICSGPDGFYTQRFDVSAGIEFNKIYDNYEEDFKETFSDIVIKKLTDKNYNKGIVLLHGAPGTGKTTYLRYLFTKLTDKTVLYLAPDMARSISDPSFITFLMDHPNSVLIIEDAENVIATREAGANQAVSNILNLTDGILGSALNYQIICTFNAPYTEIDSALKRKGRLIGEYEFKTLSPERTEQLVKKLYGDNAKPLAKSMTIADIHSMHDDVPTSEETKKSIGFV